MAKIRIRRVLLFAVAAVLAAGLTAPYIDAQGYRARIESALERALNRKVKLGEVRFNLFTGPGFTVSNVEIADDPSVGIEPLAYVESLEARVTLRSLFTPQLSFSNLKLKNPTVNLVKNDSGTWNFQLLRAASGALPDIQVREGRINFKFGDTRSVFYLSQSDVDIRPLDHSRMDVRFEGQPARTDQAARNFGQLLARGIWKRDAGESELDFNAELERSAVSELARLIEGTGIGVHGVVAAKAHVSGPISNLAVTGQMKLEDIHRWDLLSKGGGWQLNYHGKIDLMGQTLDIEAAEKDNPGTPVSVGLHASGMLSTPRWSAELGLHDVPAGAAVEVARHMGVAIPESVQVEGKLNGEVGLTQPGDFQGQLAASDATVRIPGAPAMKFRSVEVVLEGTTVRVGPGIVESENGQTAELAAQYQFSDSSLNVSVSTQAMSVVELQKGGGVSVPVLGALVQGQWKGSLRYTQSAETPGAWNGDFDIHDARVDVPGLAEPVKVTAASISVQGKRFAATRIRARAGAVKFTGELRGDDLHASRFKLETPEAELAELERLFLPTLQRREGLLARFRLRAAPVPEWLHERKAAGSFAIDKLTVMDQVWEAAKARVEWSGTGVHLLGFEASRNGVSAQAEVDLDLSASEPHYRVQGRFSEIDYKGGTLSLQGSATTSGIHSAVLTNAHGEGSFEGENLTLAPDAEFKSISGGFDWVSPLRLKLKNIQAVQGSDTLAGQGTTQADGKVLIELSGGRRQVKVVAGLTGSTAK